MYAVIILEEAHEDLKKIVGYIANENPVQQRRSVANCSTQQ
jgi:plasmid stabilization system protein ParE